MNYKNILKVSLAVLASVAVLAGCAKKEFEEITEITLSRCLEPQNLSARVDVATGDNVLFGWDVNKDAQLYLLTVYGDAELTNEVKNWELEPSAVPFLTRLTADQKYWFTVQAFRVDADGFRIEESASKIAVFDSESGIKTYAVKDNLFLEITGVSENSVSLAWSKDVSDFEEVTDLQAVPVKGGKTVKKELSAAEKTAAAATIDGLEASTEYQVTLFYLSASRGTKDVWTKAAQGSATRITTSEELKSAVASGGEYYLAYTEDVYSMSTAKPVSSLTLIGEAGPEGERPAITGAVEISSALASGSSIRLEGLKFADNGSNSFLLTFTDDAAAASVDKIEVVNCEISGYKSGLFSLNKKGGFSANEISFETCDIFNILGSGGDGFDVRQPCNIKSVKFINNTIYDGFRTFVRLDQVGGIVIESFDIENNTIKNVATMDDGNNRAFFSPYVQTKLILKKNLFLYEDGGKTDEGVVDKAQLVHENTKTVDPEITASDNYVFAQGKDFFKRKTAADLGAKVMTVDPCYNSKGNFFQLAAQDLIDGQIGASKWWISYVEKPEDLTQNVVSAPHVWNLQDASLFAGEVKNSRVRDELLLVGTEETPLNADGGINFLGATVVSRRGMPEEGYAAFKVDAPGSVDILLADPAKTGGSVVIALADDNGIAIQGGAAVSSDGVQKILVPKVDGEGTIYIYALGAVSMTKLAWSADTEGGNKVLATPKPVVEPVTVMEGEETAVTLTWEAVDNAASYQVVFNKRTQTPQTELSFTVPAEDIAALKAGLYNFTVQALPGEDDIYYMKSEPGAASFAIQPKGGEEQVEVTLTWNFSDADWQAAFAEAGAAKTDITDWDITLNGLTLHSGSKSKYDATYFQFGGKSGDMDRYFAFTAPEQGTLKITVSNTGSSEALDRTVAVTVGEDTQAQPGGFSSSAPEVLEYSVAAGNVIITAPVNGLRFYKIEFTYMTGGKQSYEFDWDFSTSDWQAALTELGGVNTDITNIDITVEGLQFHSGSKSKYNTTYIQFGGKSGDMDRYFKFTAPEQGTLKITCSNTGSSEAMDRTVKVTVGEDSQAQPGGFSKSTPGELEFSIPAGDVVITAPENGLCFYKIHYNN